eukprot:100813-Chlamydomonas_euryale.AAC.3
MKLPSLLQRERARYPTNRGMVINQVFSHGYTSLSISTSIQIEVRRATAVLRLKKSLRRANSSRPPPPEVWLACACVDVNGEGALCPFFPTAYEPVQLPNRRGIEPSREKYFTMASAVQLLDAAIAKLDAMLQPAPSAQAAASSSRASATTAAPEPSEGACSTPNDRKGHRPMRVGIGSRAGLPRRALPR